MQWETMTDREKVRMVLVEVLGATIYDDYQAYIAELRKTREDEGENVEDRGPYAFYDERKRLCRVAEWYVSHKKCDEPIAFDPVHDLDDAWEIVERKFKDHMVTVRRWEDSAHFDRPYNFHIDPGMSKEISVGGVTLNDAVCMAALKFCGIEV